jgi:hypothetical protein
MGRFCAGAELPVKLVSRIFGTTAPGRGFGLVSLSLGAGCQGLGSGGLRFASDFMACHLLV